MAKKKKTQDTSPLAMGKKQQGSAANKRASKTGSNKSSQSSVSQKDRINQKSYGTTTPSVSRRTSGSSSTLTTQQRQNQKSYGNMSGPTSRAATSAEQRRQNTAYNNNLKQTQAEANRKRLEEDRLARKAESEKRRGISSGLASEMQRKKDPLGINEANKVENRYNKNNAKTAATAKEMMAQREQDKVDARNQKSGTMTESLKAKQAANKEKLQKSSLGRMVGNAPERVVEREKGILLNSAAGISDIGSMLNDEKSNKNGRLAEDFNGLLPDAKNTKKQMQGAYQDYKDKASKSASKLSKLTDKSASNWVEGKYYEAEDVGQGMLSDKALSMATGGNWAIPLFFRVYGQARGTAQAEGATLTEDRLNALWNAGVEIGTEGLGGYFGKENRIVGKLGSKLEDKIVNRFGKGAAKKVVSFLARWERTNIEESIEELMGNPLQNAGEDIIYRNRLQNQRVEESNSALDELGSSIQKAFAENPAEVESYIADINSPQTRDSFVDDFMTNNHMSKEQAEAAADKMLDFMEAAAMNDVQRMKELQASLSKDMAGDVTKKVWDWKDNLNSILVTHIVGIGAVGMPANTMAQGEAILSDPNSKAAIENALRKTAAFDSENKDKSQALLDSMSNGYEPTATQAYDIMSNENKVMAEANERQAASEQVKAKGIERENLTAPVSVVRSDGKHVIVGEQTAERYLNRAVDTFELIGSIHDKDAKTSDEVAEKMADIVPSFDVGTLDVSHTANLTIDHPEERYIFSEMTGIDLNQFNVYKKNGEVDSVKSNINMQEKLLARSAQNYIQSARIEQEAWNDEARGRAAAAINQSIGTNEIGPRPSTTYDALMSVDPRDQTKFRTTGIVAQNIYDHAWNTQDSWEDVKKSYSKQYKSVDVDALKGVYEQAKEDRAKQETPYYGSKVTAGESTTKIEGEKQGVVRGRFINTTPYDPETDTGRDPGLEEIAIYDSIASNLEYDVVMVDPKDERLKTVDPKTRKSIYGNAVVHLSDGVIYISNASDPSKIIHEATHIGAKYASAAYLEMAHYIMDRAYKVDPEGTKALVEKYRKLYKGQGLNDVQIEEEVVADLVSVYMTDEEFIKGLAHDNPTGFKKIIRAIEDFLRKLRNILATGHITDPELQDAFLSEIGALDDVRKMMLRMLDEASKARADQAINDWQDAANGDSKSDERFSVHDYTKKQYNNYGWARANNVLSQKEYASWNDQIKSSEEMHAHNKAFDGSYMIPVGDKDHVKNKIVYTKGTKQNPYITKVVAFDVNVYADYDVETYLSDIREAIYEAEKSYSNAVQYVARNFPEGFCTEFVRDDMPIYGEHSRRAERVRSGTYYVDDEYNEREGSFGEPVKRYTPEEFEQRFSLSEPVERVRDLIAVHNIWPDDLIRSLDMGGFAMPSIAVIRDNMEHDKYGSISLLFGSDTIDPQLSKYNRVWGGDAYTPTFPTVERKFSDEKGTEIEDHLLRLFGAEDRVDFNENYKGLYLPSFDQDNLSNKLWQGTTPAEAYERELSLRLAFLLEKNNAPAVPLMSVNMQNEGEYFWRTLANKIPENELNEYLMGDLSVQDRMDRFEPIIRETIKESKVNRKFYKEHPKLAEKFDEKLFFADVDRYMHDLLKYYNEGGMPQRVDENKLRSELNERIDEDEYKAWVNNLFDGIVEAEGIRNEKDLFTSSGTRRSWESLHEPVTLQNVVAAMRSELQAGQGNFGGVVKGAAQKEYESLDEIREDEDRLQKLDDEEYEALMNEAEEKVDAALDAINEHNPTGSSYYIRTKYDIGGYVAEILNKTRKKETIQKKLQKDYDIEATDEMMDDLMEGIDAIAEIPTGYFEAKPARAIPITEVKAAVLPAVDSSISTELRERLQDDGIKVYDYDSSVEGDRRRAVNEAADEQDIRFSISEDTSGNKLSEGQQTYFSNSKIVDSDGRLKVMYHGTPNMGFTVFDLKKSQPGTLGRGFYFTDSTSHSGHYGDAYEVYLNIENPLQADTNNITKDQIKAFVQALADNEDYGLDNYGYDATVDSVVDSVWGKSDFAMIRDLNLSAVGDMAEALRLFNYTNGTDYDGIVTDVETLAMRPEQIKLIGNINPTANEDIRFSVSDDDYMEAVNQALELEETDYLEYMKAIRAIEKMVDRAAMEAGYGTKAYHGTKAEPFNVFKRDYVANGRLYGDGFYFSPLEDIALSYGETRPFYLKTNDVSENELGWDTLAAKEHRYFDNREEAIEFFNDKYQNFVDYGQDIERFRPEADVTEDGRYKVSYTTVGAFEHGFIMVATEPEYIKSAEPIVRDDSGNIIPISKRFNDHSIDTRFSIPNTDADGNALTVEQRAYFDGSKAVDEQGRLLVLYHGTDQAGFTVFNPVWESGAARLIWMTTSRRDADAYGGNWEHKLFDANEKESKETTTAGDYNLADINPSYAYMRFDTESDKAQFIEEHPDISNAHDYWTLDDMLYNDEIDEREFNRLREADKKILSDYSKYEEKHSMISTWGDVFDNPEKFEKRDLARALLAYDKEAAIDEEEEDTKETLFEVMQSIEAEHVADGESMRDVSFKSRIPVGETQEYVHKVNNRTYKLYANMEHPLVVDIHGRHMSDGGYAYIDEMQASDEYDGIIIYNTAVGRYADPQTVVVAKASHQVKDVNNTDPTENPDIRYSITDDEESKSRIAYEDAMDNSYEALERYEQLIDMVDPETYNIPAFQEDKLVAFYSSLKADETVPSEDPVLEENRVRIAKSKADFYNSLNAKWQDRWTTGGEVLDVKSVKTDIRNLVIGVMNNSDTSAKYRNDIVKKTLMDVRTAFQLMKQDRSDIASYLLYHSAQRMIDNVEFYTDDTFDMYKDLKHYLSTTKISLGEEYWSDVDYNAFRRRNFGRLKLVKGETNVDEIYQELQEKYPEWFDEDETMTPPDQLLEIEHVLDSIQPYKEAYSSEAAAELAFDIAGELYDIMAGGKEVRSLADQYKERYDAKTKAMKQRHAEAMLRMRKARNEGVQAEKAKWRAREEKRKERTAHSTYFDRIKRTYDKLSDRLLSNTADKHIPEQYKKELAGLLAAFDFQTVRSKNIEAKRGYKAQKTIKLESMRTALERIESKSQLFHINDSVTDIMNDLLGLNDEGVQESIEGKTLDELSAAELAKIDKLLRSLLHEFNNYENVRVGSKKQQAADIGHVQNDISLEHAEALGEGKDYQVPGLQGIDRLLHLDMMTPAYLFRMIDPNSEGLGIMWKEIRRSFDKYVKNTEQLNEWIEEIVGKYHDKGILWNKYGSGELSKWRSTNYARTFNLTNGTIQLTPAQMMSVYCLAKRGQAYDHMVGAGVVVAPVSFEAKIMSDVKQKINKSLPVILNDVDIKTIVGELTPEQVKVAEQLQELMATKMAAWGNEASMNVIGIKLFEDPDYFPIRSDRAGLTKDLDPNQFEQAIRNFGFTKAVQPGARNAIMIDDIFDVVTEHCNNMNLYNAYTEAMNDFMKVYNYREFREEGEYTVEQALRHAFSDKAPMFIMQFMRDLNGNVSGRASGIESMYNALLSNAKKASVFANARVAAQQPTAISRAFYVIDAKYMKGIKISKGAMEEMFEHCPIALWKSWGYYDINMGKSIEDVIMNNGKWLEEKATDLYGALDNVTWTAIWQMVKAEMKDTHPDVKPGTDEYWELCNERMSEIVDLTQVVDSPMHRSHLMRSKQFHHKAATAFMAEPTLTYNMLRDGLGRTQEAVKRGKIKLAGQILTRTIGVYLLQCTMVAGAQAIIDALRGKNPNGDDDEDETLLHLFWVNFLENWRDEFNPLGKIYFIKDVKSMFDGWENRNLALQGVYYLSLAYRQLKGDKYARSSKSWYENMLYGFGYLSGIPIKTMMTGISNAMRMAGIESPALHSYGEYLDSLAKEPEDSESEVADTTSTIGKLFSLIDGDSALLKKSSGKSDGEKGSDKESADKEADARTKAESDRDELRKLEEKARKKAAGLSGDELDEALWDVLGEGYTKKLDEADMDYIEHLELIYMNCGGDISKFDARIKDRIDTAYKKTLKDEMTTEDYDNQYTMRLYMQKYGYTDDEISDIVYHTYARSDLQAAMRMGNQQFIEEEANKLILAGLSEADFEKAYKNRNRGRKTYKGKYSDEKYLKSTGTYVWPAQGPITSEFGYRNAPTAGASSNHPAIDIGAAYGSPVVAADGGTVVSVGWNGGYGNQVAVQSDDGKTVLYYSHLSDWNVNVGDRVSQGAQIAQVGSTGNSTGPHLDFKVEVNGEPVNPMDYLSSDNAQYALDA